MIEVKNQFLRHAIFWVLFLPFALTLGMPAFLDSDSFVLHPGEISFFFDMGVNTLAVTERANAIFHKLFVETGIQEVSKGLFVHENKFDTKIIELAGRTTATWHYSLWNMVYRALWRLLALLPLYLSGIVSFVIPAFVDGLVVRAKKKYNFLSHNPMFFNVSTHFAVLLVGLSVFLPFMPIALGAWPLGAFFFVLAGSLWIVSANFQSGL
jgi:hypothetical protein